MKRSAFVRNVLEQRATYEEWARMVTRDRVGEAPHHLLCEWRRAYDVPAHVPYGTCTVVSQQPLSFHLECGDRVLMYGRLDASNRPRVTLYHATDGERTYKAWKRYRREWPVRGAPAWWETLPPDVHQLIFRAVRVAVGSWCRSVLVYGLPICKNWLGFWNAHYRFIIPGYSDFRLVCLMANCALCAFDADARTLRKMWTERIFDFLNRKDNLPILGQKNFNSDCPVLWSAAFCVGWKQSEAGGSGGGGFVFGIWNKNDPPNKARMVATTAEALVNCFIGAKRGLFNVK